MKEASRQAVHMSGLAFVLFAQYAGGLPSAAIFFLITMFFFAYGEHVLAFERRDKSVLDKAEARLREFALFFERDGQARPFAGAFWFYLGLGLVFLLFPLKAASAAGCILAVGDSLSTVVGSRWGRHKLIGRKTWEGSLAFIVGSFLICMLFFNPWESGLAASAATLAELLPATRLSRSRLSPLLDDNLLVPLAAGFVLSAVML